LANLEKFLKICKEKHLILNQKVSFHGKKGIIFGYVIFSDTIEVDKVKIDLIASLSPPTCE